MTKKTLPNERDQETLDRYVGQCMQRIEAVRLEKGTEEVLKDIVKKQMRGMAWQLVGGGDEED